MEPQKATTAKIRVYIYIHISIHPSMQLLTQDASYILGLAEPRVRTREIHGYLTALRYTAIIFPFFLLPCGSLCRRVSVRPVAAKVAAVLTRRSARNEAVQPMLQTPGSGGRAEGLGPATPRGTNSNHRHHIMI